MSRFDIAGKTVLVTGGTRGLGKSIAMHLASQGANVFAGYFQNEAAAEAFRAESASAGYPCSTIKANLMTASGIRAVYDQVAATSGRLDALVYNSATGVHKPLEALTQRQLAIVWQVNVGAFLDLALMFKPRMPPGSSILALSSEGATRAVDQYGAVGSSKAALEALCRQMAAEWAPSGISVNLVSPGLLQTDTLTAIERAEERVAHEIKASPMGRLVQLDEIAHVVHFLCSEASNGIIGQTLIVDGGKRISGLLR